MTEQEMEERVMEVLNPGGDPEKKRTLGFTVIYRKLFGKASDPGREAALLKVLGRLVEEGVLDQQPNFGVGEPPYTPV